MSPIKEDYKALYPFIKSWCQ